MRYVGLALSLVLVPAPGWAWTCAYLWQDITPVVGVFPGKDASQDTRLKVCYVEGAYALTVEQRYFHTIRLADGKEVDEDISPWRVLTSEVLPRAPSESPGGTEWDKKWEETGTPWGVSGGGY